MLFCWIEKEILSDFIEFWESQKFYFVESVCWVMLDPDRLPGMFARAHLQKSRGGKASTFHLLLFLRTQHSYQLQESKEGVRNKQSNSCQRPS